MSNEARCAIKKLKDNSIELQISETIGGWSGNTVEDILEKLRKNQDVIYRKASEYLQPEHEKRLVIGVVGEHIEALMRDYTGGHCYLLKEFMETMENQSAAFQNRIVFMLHCFYMNGMGDQLNKSAEIGRENSKNVKTVEDKTKPFWGNKKYSEDDEKRIAECIYKEYMSSNFPTNKGRKSYAYSRYYEINKTELPDKKTLIGYFKKYYPELFRK